MAEAKRLEQFLAVPTDEGADITIQVEGTAPVTVSVSLEQVEDILDCSTMSWMPRTMVTRKRKMLNSREMHAGRARRRSF